MMLPDPIFKSAAIDAAIYARQSSKRQSLKDISLPDQIDTCRAFAEKMGWNIIGVYQDTKSGKTDQRDGFQRLVFDARAGKFKVIIVLKYNRFARSVVDSAVYERELNNLGIMLVSATEPAYSNSASDWLVKHMLQNIAEFENIQKAEVIRSAMKKKLLRGEWTWQAPVGYLNKHESIGGKRYKTWVEIDPVKSPSVVTIFDEADKGRTLCELCDTAEELGLTTVRKKKFTPQKMSEMLKNPFYIGKIVSPKMEIEVDGLHEKLIDEDLFDRVQMKIAIRSRAPYSSHSRKHILRGLTRCSCGMAMTAEFHDNGANSYLRCVSNANRRYKPCGQIGPRIDSVVAQIESEILPLLSISPDDVITIREELKGLMQHDYHVLEAEVQLIREQLIKLDARAKGLMNMRADNELTKDEYRVRKGELDIDRAKLTHSLEMKNIVLSKCDEDLNKALETASSIMQLWQNADDEGKHELLETVLVKLVIHDKKIQDVEFRMPYNFLARWKSNPAAIKAQRS